ncbi:hypothetical protein MJD09_15500, partial [bacterium]|nr:hypothetical protein [bacterium]
LQNELESLNEKKEKLKESILNSRSELQTIRERIELLKKFIESYEDHPEGVQHLLLQGHLNGGCKGTLGEILTVESAYRQAIETALGEAAVSLIVDETDQALRCIEVLKSEHKGSVTFFPLDRFSKTVKESPSLDLRELREGSDGVIDWAFNLVKCNRDFQPMIKSLLRDYVVVSDLNVATKHVRKLQDRRVNFITLNGEIVSSWGPIKGGGNGASQSGIVGRKALIEELEKKSKAQFKLLEKEEAERANLEKRLVEVSQQEQKIGESAKAAEARQTQLEIELAQLEFESKREKEAQDRLIKEKAQLTESQIELLQKIEKIHPSLTNMAENRTKYDEKFKQVSDELVRLETELNDHRVVVQDSQVKLVDLKGEEQRLQEDIARKQDFERELKESLRRIGKEMISNKDESVELEKRIEENKGLIKQDFDRHSELQGQVQNLEQEYYGEKEKLEKRERSVKDVRIEKDQASENLHSVELRVSELKMEQGRIAEKIRDDYEVKLSTEPIEEDLDTEAMRSEIGRLKERITTMEPVNLLALKEYEKEKGRFEFLTEQKKDLLEAESNLQETINVINKTAASQFAVSFGKIQENFKKVFVGFFPDGQANLQMATSSDPLEAEIIIEADPKGRRISSLSLLSGGEKALTAISLLFAIYLVKPSPFCILDEVDAPLDDANIGRFTEAIRNFAVDTQFLIVTHNKLTMRSADCLYGVTMEEEGISKVVSVNFTNMDLEQTPKAA